ncbi:MAG: glycosyltransferase family 2 protein, partial [Paracoccaceae bacterium]
MHYSSLPDFIAKGAAILAKGPIAVILAEDAVEVDTTIRHHQNAGFRAIILLAPDGLAVPPELEAKLHRVAYNVHADTALPDAINALIDAADGTWIYYCYNAEYLFHPFCETRNIRELLAFHAEERRDAILSYVVDLYAADLDRFQNAVSLETALLDRSG